MALAVQRAPEAAPTPWRSLLLTATAGAALRTGAVGQLAEVRQSGQAEGPASRRSVTETKSPLEALALICMLYRSSVPATAAPARN